MTVGGHAVGARIRYAHAAPRVRRWVEQRLGGPVASVIDCVGGMSPGPAARVRTRSGAAAFVKTCGTSLNRDTPGLLRSEARVLAALPAHPCLPELIDVYDDGDWVALLVEDLPGAPQPAPWRRDDLRRVGEALRELRPVLDATELDGVPAAREAAPIFLTRWRELEGRLHLLDPWWAAHHDELAGHAQRAAALIGGQALLHWDIRADNVILTGDRVVVIDWAQARRGAPWMDHALLALDCSMSGSELSTAQLAATDPVLRAHDPGDLLALAAAAAMSFPSRSTEPAPPGLPTLPATSSRWADGLRPYLAATLGTVGQRGWKRLAAREDVLVTRLVMWWAGLAASIVLMFAALTNKSGTCIDSADAAASSCSTTGSGGMLLVGVAAFGLSLSTRRRAYRARRR